MIFKKTNLILLILLTFIFSLKARAFSDVYEDYVHFSAINYLSDRKIVSGYSDYKFQPEANINRVETLKIILEALNLKNDVKSESTKLTDVDINGWYYAYLSNALKRGIVSGYPDKTFRPTNPINKAEVLKMLFNSAFLNLSAPSSPPYPDVSEKAWYAMYVSKAKEMKLVSSEKDGNFNPNQIMKRGDVAEIVYRYIYIVDKRLTHFNPSLNWPYFEQASTYLKIKYPINYKIVKTSVNEVVFVSDDTTGVVDYRRVQGNSSNLEIILEENFTKDKKTLQKELTSYANSLENGKIREVNLQNNLTGFLLFGGLGQENIIDLYVILPNKNFIKFIGSYGNGNRKDEIKEELYLMETSYIYLIEGGANIENILSKARSQIWVEGKGKEVIASFSGEMLIIETDSIGTGSGPVDYYYSKEADSTIKYQREKDVILGIKSGKTFLF